MANINQLVRRKQNLRMALIGLGSSAVGGGCLVSVFCTACRNSSAGTAAKSSTAQYDRCGLPDL